VGQALPEQHARDLWLCRRLGSVPAAAVVLPLPWHGSITSNHRAASAPVNHQVIHATGSVNLLKAMKGCQINQMYVYNFSLQREAAVGAICCGQKSDVVACVISIPHAGVTRFTQSRISGLTRCGASSWGQCPTPGRDTNSCRQAGRQVGRWRGAWEGG
jgi:hypothetical protein